MNSYSQIRNIVIIWLLLFVVCNEAISKDKPYFQNIDLPGPLVSKVTYSFVEDNQGFLYIGIASNLLRYDGYKTTKVKTNSINGVAYSLGLVHALLKDKQGRIWMGTENGIFIYDPVSEITITFDGINLKGVPCRALIESKYHEIIIGSDKGLHIYNPLYKKVDSYFQQAKTNHPALSHNIIRAVYEDSQGILWIGTHDKMDRFDRKNNRIDFFDLRNNKKNFNNLILSIVPCLKDSRRLWVGTGTGLCLFDTRTYNFQTVSSMDKMSPLSNNVVKTICVVDSTQIWLGTDYGLNIYYPQINKTESYLHNFENNYSINNNTISKIYKDKWGNVWLATDNGVNKVSYKNNFFQVNKLFPNSEQLKAGMSVYCFAQDHDGVFWLGTSEGLISYNERNRELIKYSPPTLLHNKIRSLLVDKNGLIWIGSPGGINIYDKKKKRFENCVSRENNSLGLQIIYISCLKEDAYGNVWAGTYDDGVYKMTYRKSGDILIKNFRKDPENEASLSSNYIQDIEADDKDALWIATNNGVNVIHPIMDKVERMFEATTPSINTSINQILCSGNNVWIAAYENLFHYNVINKNLSVVKNIPLNLRAMFESNGKLWFSTYDDIYHYDYIKKELYRIPMQTIGVGNYINRAFYIRNGRGYFGGYEGFISFDTNDFHKENHQREVHFSSLEVLGSEVKTGEIYEGRVLLEKNIDYTDKVVLSYTENTIAINLSSLDFGNDNKRAFLYKLDGYDDDWKVLSGGHHRIEYTKLPFGKYIFHVKAINEQGFYPQKSRDLIIKVRPPFYATIWAIAIYFVLFCFVLYMIYNFFSRKIKEENEIRYQQLQRKKMEELIEIKSRFFTNVSHELKTPLTLILNPVERLLSREDDKQKINTLQLVKRNTERVLKLVNQILDMRRIERGQEKLMLQEINIVVFCKLILDSFSDEAISRNIKVLFKYDTSVLNLWLDSNKVDKIIVNLLSNAFKFTPDNGTVSLEINSNGTTVENGDIESPRYVFISVTDTGSGISKEELVSVFDRFSAVQSVNYTSQIGSGIGLSIVKEYVELHKGNITVESKVGEGSKFTFTLPRDKKMLVDSTDEPEISDEDDKDTFAMAMNVLSGGEEYKPTVLLVDDDRDLLTFVRDIFLDDFNVLTETDGVKAWNNIIINFPDIIVADVMMPNMTGIELCKNVKSDMRTSHIPLILLTAKGSQDDILEGISAGADDYIQKPFNMEYLLLRTKKILEMRESMRKKFLLDSKSELHEISINTLDDKFLNQFFDILNDNMGNPKLSIQAMCDMMGLSYNNVHSKVKALTGMTIIELLKAQRLKQAAKLLENEHLNITEIMYTVGFTHNSYFTRAFKNMYGATPSDYRNNLKADKTN